MKKYLVGAALSALVLVPATAHAQLRGPALARFQQLDTDKSGEIDRKEYEAELKQRFEAMDANGNNQLTREEHMGKAADLTGPRAPKVQALKKKRFDALDKNSDQKITRTEWQNGGRDRFNAIDKDGSNTLTQDEFRSQGAE